MPFIPLLGRNIIANGVGRAWTMIMSFVFVPFYLHYLGVEAYGLIGFFATLMALFSFLDLGLPTTLNRELAKRAESSIERGTMRMVVRTLEIVYAGIGLVIGGLMFTLAEPIAINWLNPESLSVSEVEAAIRLMGVVIACQWPAGLYAGGLLGLQRQVTANVLSASVMTFRGVGAIVVLAFAETSITAFFVFQAFVSLAAVILGRSILISSLPPGLSRFDIAVLKEVWKFAAGMMGVAAVTIILMQTDKIMLSIILPLEDYSKYILAYTMGAAAGFVGGPIYNAIFPRFTQLVTVNDKSALRRAFLTQAQLLGTVVAVMTVVIMSFTQELVHFWTQDAGLASEVAPMARMLALGGALNSIMLVPYALILANGKVHYTLITNAVAVIIIVPLIYFLAQARGGLGASFAWPLLNVGYILVQAPIVLSILLPGVFWTWLIRGIVLPLFVATLAVAPFQILLPSSLSVNRVMPVVIFAFVTSLLATAIASPEFRKYLIIINLRFKRQKILVR